MTVDQNGQDSNLLSSSIPVSLVTLRARFIRSGFGVPGKGDGVVGVERGVGGGC